MDIAPSIFQLSKRKNSTVQEALLDLAWVARINISDGLSVNHLQQFHALWTLLEPIQLHEHVQDDISWNLTNNRVYSATSAYKVQFEGTIPTAMVPAVWSNWAPPKCKFFAWLVMKNRVWTADRLQKQGWPNCGLCQLCKREPESAAHILFKCRYSLRIWAAVKTGFDVPELNIAIWGGFRTVQHWWTSTVLRRGHRRRAISSLLVLVTWEIWNERNSRVFRSKVLLAFFANRQHPLGG